MYGSDSSQAASLAATGLGGWGLAAGWSILATGVLVVAGLTLFTLGRVLAWRAASEEVDGEWFWSDR